MVALLLIREDTEPNNFKFFFHTTLSD
jgi:hypothetical protein